MLNDQTALLLLDFQLDFLDSKGRYPVAHDQVEPMITTANRLIAAAQSAGAKIVYIGNEFSPRDLLNLTRNSCAIKGSAGTHLDPRLKVVSEYYFPKDKNSAFTNPDLNAFLQKQHVTQLWIVGVFATACVRATALDGQRLGYQVGVVSDAVAAANDQGRRSALDAMAHKGVSILTSAELVIHHD